MYISSVSSEVCFSLFHQYFDFATQKTLSAKWSAHPQPGARPTSGPRPTSDPP